VELEEVKVVEDTVTGRTTIVQVQVVDNGLVTVTTPVEVTEEDTVVAELVEVATEVIQPTVVVTVGPSGWCNWPILLPTSSVNQILKLSEEVGGVKYWMVMPKGRLPVDGTGYSTNTLSPGIYLPILLPTYSVNQTSLVLLSTTM